MDCSTPGILVLHHLLEPAQTHVHRFGDVIQLSHPLSSHSPPAFNLPQHQGPLQGDNSSFFFILFLNFTRWSKYWSFSFSISPSNEYSGLISFRIDWFDLLCSPRDSQESSPTPQLRSTSSSVLSLIYSPTLISILDY